MKFISLFTKTPSYKRFSYEPRFYDAKAEERKAREERIRQEIERERGHVPEESIGYRTRIRGSFQSSRKRSQKSSGELNAVLLRLGVILFLTLFIMAFLTWGKVVTYSLVLFVPVYFYLKFRKN